MAEYIEREAFIARQGEVQSGILDTCEELAVIIQSTNRRQRNDT